MSFPNEIEIPEVSSAEDPAFADALAQSRPMIVRGMASSWPAVERWTQEYLTERLGELKLTFHEGKSGAFPDPMGMRILQLRFADYLESLWSGTMERPTLLDGDSALMFAGRETRDEDFAPLEQDVVLPSCIRQEDLRQTSFWLSCKGVSSWLHYDNNLMDNINAQVKGSKSVVLFSPDDTPNLYLHTYTVDGVNRAQFSRVDLRAPDAERFPDLRKAQAWVGVIHAGDTVFIPSCWYHGFRHLGEINLNVNFWWQPEAIPWNAITARRSLWETVQSTLANGNGNRPVAEHLAELPDESRGLIERLERTVLGAPPPFRVS